MFARGCLPLTSVVAVEGMASVLQKLEQVGKRKAKAAAARGQQLPDLAAAASRRETCYRDTRQHHKQLTKSAINSLDERARRALPFCNITSANACNK